MGPCIWTEDDYEIGENDGTGFPPRPEPETEEESEDENS